MTLHSRRAIVNSPVLSGRLNFLEAAVQITITGRHVEITPDLKELVERSLDFVPRYFDRVTGAKVVLTGEKHRKICEISIHAGHWDVHVEEVTEDVATAVRRAADKLDTRLRRLKERIKEHKPRPQERQRKMEIDIFAAREFAESEVGSTPEVVRTKSFAIKPLTLSEAMLQLELMDEGLLLFENVEEGGKTSVLYKRPDGTCGLVVKE